MSRAAAWKINPYGEGGLMRLVVIQGRRDVLSPDDRHQSELPGPSALLTNEDDQIFQAAVARSSIEIRSWQIVWTTRPSSST